MFKLLFNHHNKGQSLIEILIAIALTAIFLPALITGLVASREGRAQQIQRLEATTLAKEVEEAVRTVRENDWNSFAVNGTYHPINSGTTWTLVSGSELINGFTRSVVVSDVQRDINGDIVASAGTVDPSTKKVEISVSWNTPITSSVSYTIYLTRFMKNSSFGQTSENDFTDGTQKSVIVTNSSGGEVVLAAGGHGSWCAPNLSIAALDLPRQGVANAVSAISGQGFAGTGENASGVSFANITINNPPYPTPPAASIAGTFDGYKTNDGVFGEANYAYLATDNNFKEIVIVDLTLQDSNGKYSEAGHFNAPGNVSARSVFVSGNIGYMTTTADKLYTFDLSSKSGSRPQLNTSTITLSGTGNRVTVNSGYIYVATGSTTNQLQIYSVSGDGSTISLVSQLTVNGGIAKDVFVNSSATRAYLITANSASQAEFFIINIENKASPQLLSSTSVYDTNGMDPKGITVVPGNKAIIVGINAEEYQAVDITDETPDAPATSLSRCGGLNVDSGINGIASVLEADGDIYSYIITGDATTEFKIIEGGPGGSYATSGEFESATLPDPGDTVVFNRFSATVSQPSQTTIKLQVAVANAVDGSCTNSPFTFVGPNGSVSDYFYPSGNSINAAVPVSTSGPGSYINPGRCFRYKVFFTTTDILQSPTLYDFTVNYSP